jgi:hypothetical protein
LSVVEQSNGFGGGLWVYGKFVELELLRLVHELRVS